MLIQKFNSAQREPHLQYTPNLHRGSGDSPTKVTPDAPLQVKGYHLTPGPWWACICTHTGRSFGGRYSGPEIDRIAAHFRDWPRAIEPGHFGLVAEQAITDCRAAALGVAV